MRQAIFTSGTSRFAWIDYAKGFAIILVVYRHVIGGLEEEGIHIPYWLDLIQQSVYNIRMPLFFIVAGLFARKSLIKRSLNKLVHYKLNTILYPYIIWASLQLMIQIMFSQYSHAQRTFSDFVYVLYNPFALHDQFWFLFVIFFVTIVFALSTHYLKIPPLAQLFAGLTLNLLAAYIEFTPLKAICEYYLFFAVGDLISRYLLQHYKRLASFKIMIGLLPVFLISQWYWVTHLTLKEDQIILFNLIALLGSAFILSMALLLGKYGRLGWLSIIGKHSLYIYIMHVIIQGGIRALLVNFLHITELSIILPVVLSLAVVLPIYLYKASMWSGMWYLYNFQKPDDEYKEKQNLVIGKQAA